MDKATYEVENRIEQQHWWFVGRRRLFRDAIQELGLPRDAAILDIGTSTGSNLRMLKDIGFTNVQGLDPDDDAIRFCAEKGLGVVRKGDVCSMPFGNAEFDLVLATDIIEHVDDDVAALLEIRRVLKPGGRAIVTVPAFKFLWGLQDEVAHHKRRYTRRQLLERLQKAGLRPHDSYYFNFLLLPPIWAARQVLRVLKPNISSENELATPLINKVLKGIFTVDVLCAKRLRIPFGVSVFAFVGSDNV